MLNWNTDEKMLKKLHPNDFVLWKVTQLINYGLYGEKLDGAFIKLSWDKIKDRLNPDKRKVLEFLLWDKKWHKEPGLLPNRSNYWIWQSKSHTS